MPVYRRKWKDNDGKTVVGKIWWYKFKVGGVECRESSKSTSKTKCLEAERIRRREIEDNHNRIVKRPKPIKFVDAATQFIESQVDWSAKTHVIHNLSLEKHLKPHFKNCLLSEITAEKINRYQSARLKEEKPPTGRTINIEVALIRLVMRKHKMWANISGDVKMLKENKDVGRDLTEEEQDKLLAAAKESVSRSLYPAILVSIHTGLRNEELRLLRWHQVDFIEGSITVGKSKTEGGEGRVVPLSQTALQTLKDWRSQFPNAVPDHYVFPSERYGLKGVKGTFGGCVVPYHTFPDRPIASWKSAWNAAKERAGFIVVTYVENPNGKKPRKKVQVLQSIRWHDLRHSFVSRIASAGVPDATIKAMAGWMSGKMLERYSHTRYEAKKAAVAVFDTTSRVQ